MTALTGRPLDAPTVSTAGLNFGGGTAAAVRPTPNFVDDAIAAFYLAGRVANLSYLGVYTAISIGAVAIATALMVLPASPLLFPAAVGLMVAVVSMIFCWQVLHSTLAGEDVMPLVDSGWDPWEQSVRPTLALIGGLIVYAVPALVLYRYVPAQIDPHRAWAIAALGLPLLFLPLMIAFVGIGKPQWMLSPRAVARALARLGCRYALASCGVAAALAVVGLAVHFRGRITMVPVFGMLLFTLTFLPTLFYCCFVVFRIGGLLARSVATGDADDA